MRRFQSIRKLVLALTLVVGLAPMTALAGTPSRSASIEACIKSAITSGAHALTKAQAQQCAPTDASVAADGSGGYMIVDSSTSVTSSVPRAATASTSYTQCGWKTYLIYLAGITDQLGGKFCWIMYQAVWIADGPHAGCYSYLPGAGCFYQSTWTGPSVSYYKQINADYFQNCVFGVPCNRYAYLGVFWDGGQIAGGNGI